jgi:hypothetical protein
VLMSTSSTVSRCFLLQVVLVQTDTPFSLALLMAHVDDVQC